MVSSGFHIKAQKIDTHTTYTRAYGYIIYWVQKRVLFLGIPVYVKNLRAYPTVESAIAFISRCEK